MPTVDAVAVLAEQIVRCLEDQRSRGPGAYPLTLAQLPALIDPETTPELLDKALGRKPFAARLVVADKKSPDSPLALTEDAAALADSPLLLRFALNGLCTAVTPLQPLRKVAARVDRQLRPHFTAALQRRLENRSWPSGVNVLLVRGQPHLFLEDHPPRAQAAVQVLIARLLTALEAGRGEVFTPRSLAEAVEPTASEEQVQEALKSKAIRGRILSAFPDDLDAPAVHVEDAACLASSPILLETALARVRTADNQAVPMTELVRVVDRNLRAAFLAAVAAQIEAKTLPASVGCLRVRKVPHLFFRDDQTTGERGLR